MSPFPGEPPSSVPLHGRGRQDRVESVCHHLESTGPAGGPSPGVVRAACLAGAGRRSTSVGPHTPGGEPGRVRRGRGPRRSETHLASLGLVEPSAFRRVVQRLPLHRHDHRARPPAEQAPLRPDRARIRHVPPSRFRTVLAACASRWLAGLLHPAADRGVHRVAASRADACLRRSGAFPPVPGPPELDHRASRTCVTAGLGPLAVRLPCGRFDLGALLPRSSSRRGPPCSGTRREALLGFPPGRSGLRRRGRAAVVGATDRT